jgi:ATP-dependent DNA helicase DinG
LVSQVEEIFSPTGILSRAKNFEFRPQQQEMAVAVARALQNREHLAVEAGTGVGKSLAYLIPAILFAVAQKKKAIVSTHTINLQEQLTEKDLPMLAGARRAAGAGEVQLRDAEGPRELSLHAPAAKGDAAERQSVHVVRGRGIAAHLRMVEGNQGRQPVGFFHRAGPESLGAGLFRARAVFAENVRAPVRFRADHDVCFFQRVRNRILVADVVILNHTLFFTLLGGVDEEMEGGILFKNDFVIFDEAHTMESVASRHIGLSVSSGQVRYSLNRLWNPRTEKGLLATLRKGQGGETRRGHLERVGQVF